MPTLGADNGLALVSMIGADYDDPQWDTLLDQLTFNEMDQHHHPGLPQHCRY